MQSDISKEDFILDQQAEVAQAEADLGKFKDELSPLAVHGIEWAIDEKKRFIQFAIDDNRVRP